MILVVTYDLRKPGKDYSSLIIAINKLQAVWKPLLSAWIVDTSSSPQQILEYLLPYMDANDGLFVAQLAENWWSSGLDPSGVKWLQSRSF